MLEPNKLTITDEMILEKMIKYHLNYGTFYKTQFVNDIGVPIQYVDTFFFKLETIGIIQYVKKVGRCHTYKIADMKGLVNVIVFRDLNYYDEHLWDKKSS